MHGGGRNSDDYRDAWIELADQYHVLILAPEFSDKAFPNARGYNLGGMESFLGFDRAPEHWAFSVIDPMVQAVMDGIGSTRDVYDLFGHSAGGQFVHRLVLFCPDAAIDRAVAANSGWYTLPTRNERFPYGLRSAPGPEVRLELSMGKELIVMLGELDNSASAGGHLRTTPEAMRQGSGRRQRGEYFLETAKQEASERGHDLSWRMTVVPDVGHNYRRMAIAAATILYGDSQGNE
jgi:pimeloyl-ACP methyl ester carboxylesterase